MPKRRLRDYLRDEWIDRLQTINIVSLTRRVGNLEVRMGQLRDFVTAVQEQTTQLGVDVGEIGRKLQDAIDSGDPSALADLGTEVARLQDIGGQLHAMATGGNEDPLPTPSNGGSAGDSSGVPVDETGTSGGIS
jgi:hypothetical protein